MILLQGKWGKAHKGKVLLYHPEGDAQPHLQLQTGSGQVVSTARVSMPLKQQVSSSYLNSLQVTYLMRGRKLSCPLLQMLQPFHTAHAKQRSLLDI